MSNDAIEPIAMPLCANSTALPVGMVLCRQCSSGRKDGGGNKDARSPLDRARNIFGLTPGTLGCVASISDIWLNHEKRDWRETKSYQ